MKSGIIDIPEFCRDFPYSLGKMGEPSWPFAQVLYETYWIVAPLTRMAEFNAVDKRTLLAETSQQVIENSPLRNCGKPAQTREKILVGVFRHPRLTTAQLLGRLAQNGDHSYALSTSSLLVPAGSASAREAEGNPGDRLARFQGFHALNITANILLLPEGIEGGEIVVPGATQKQYVERLRVAMMSGALLDQAAQDLLLPATAGVA